MMQYRGLKPGDRVPLDYPRRPFSGECEPAWFVMTTLRQRRGMVASAAWLVKAGATDAWFPETHERRQVKRGNRLFREIYDRPIVPGLVFVLSGLWPQWDVIAERKSIRPLKIGERPVAVTESVMAQMESVPQRIDDLRRVAAEAERLEREARMPKIGDTARIVTGLLSGQVALVEEIRRGEVLVCIGGAKVWMQAAAVERSA